MMGDWRTSVREEFANVESVRSTCSGEGYGEAILSRLSG